MNFVVRIDDQERNVTISKRDDHYNVEIDGESIEVDCTYFGDTGYMSLIIENRSYLIDCAAEHPEQGRYYARVMGRHYDVEVMDELLVAARDAEISSEPSGRYVLVAPMPGMVVDVKVSIGDTVAAGDPLVIMEAMKMQNELSSEVEGIVKEVRVAPQETVESQMVMIVIEQE